MSENKLLNNLSKLKTDHVKRVGRGIGSGKGKTSGHGVKGQKARSGVAIKGFEGGQTPIYMRLPKRGFVSLAKNKYEVVNIAKIAAFIEAKKIDANKAVDKKVLFENGLIKCSESKVKLIMSKDFEAKNKFSVSVDLYSEKAKEFAA